MNRASQFQYTNKVWKEKPPGPEQLLLEEMFGNGSITTYATAENVRLTSDMFKDFSPRIFAAHFRKTRARMGEFRMFHTFNEMLRLTTNNFYISFDRSWNSERCCSSIASVCQELLNSRIGCKAPASTNETVT